MEARQVAMLRLFLWGVIVLIFFEAAIKFHESFINSSSPFVNLC